MLALLLVLVGQGAARAQSIYRPYYFGTLAGTAGEGSANGPASLAQFRTPGGVAADAAGNVYVADSGNGTIRKITPDGFVKTLAGQAGSLDSVDGTGANARFVAPVGIALDSYTNLYVVDAGGHTVRKITLSGVVTTLAGLAGHPGSDDGTNGDARFNTPSGLAVKADGTVLYVADTGNHTIRKITQTVVSKQTNWVVTTFAGMAGVSGSADGTGSDARFNGPVGLGRTSLGALYVADRLNHLVRRIEPDAAVKTVAGAAQQPGSADGTDMTNTVRFFLPSAVTVDRSGNVFIADTGNNTIREINYFAPASVLTLAGSAGVEGSADGAGGGALFSKPSAIVALGNVLYVADAGTSRIRAGIPSSSLLIIMNPRSQPLRLGVNAVLSVAALGEPPLAYQWFKNGKPVLDGSGISGSTNASLSISNFQALDAGMYYATVGNASMTVTSLLAKLTLDIVAPTVTILSPSAGTRIISNSVVIAGKASDNIALDHVTVTNRNGLPAWVSGDSNWTASAALAPGTNTFDIFAQDAAGNYSRTNTLSVFCVVSAQIIVQTNGNGTIKPNYNGQFLEIGKSYTMTATPGTGGVFSNWVGSVSSQSSALTFTMQSNYVLQANFIPNPFVPAKGTYNGLFSDTNGVDFNSAGFVSASVTDKGTYSGKLSLAGKSYALSGHLSIAGFASNSMPRSGLKPLSVLLQLDTSGGDSLQGVVSDGTWTSGLRAHRGLLHATAANHTLVIPGDEASDAAPGGEGCATLALSSAGVAALSGTLADGTKISQSTALSAGGQWPLYAPLYSGNGMIFGWLTFTNRDADDINGVLHWIKRAQPKTKYYTNGFALQAEAIGSKYVAPPSGSRIVNLSGGQMVFSNGNLSGSFTNEIQMATNNKVMNLDTNKLTFATVLSKGTFSGSVTVPDSKRVLAFNGVFLQKQNAGYGYFLGTNQSGRVSVGP